MDDLDLRFETLSQSDIALLLLQRTGLMNTDATGQKPSFIGWINRDDRALFKEAESRRDLILREHSESVAWEFEQLQPWLPKAVTSIADIGPGLGIIDILFHRQFGCRCHLIDIEVTSSRYHLYEDQAAGYSRLASASTLLEDNGVSASLIRCTNPNKQSLEPIGYDVVLSTLAMGFHFPCATYQAFVAKGLRSGGVCIFDRRSDTDQDEFLSLFESIEIVAESAKWERLACRKK